MICQYCDNELPQGVTKCPYCGASCPQNAYTPDVAPAPVASVRPQIIIQNIQPQVPYVQSVQPQVAYATKQKSRVTYILLAIILGIFGIHNFYAARVGSGIIQLLITVLSSGEAVALPILWLLIEIFVVKKDGRGHPVCRFLTQGGCRLSFSRGGLPAFAGAGRCLVYAYE